MKFNIAVGLCDALTGILLIVFPEIVLSCMWIKDLPDPDVYLRYVGVFVLGTGLTYFLPIFLEREDYTYFVWWQTSLIRYLVCIFVASQVFLGALSTQWLIVAATDGIIAAIQTYFLFERKR